MLASGLVWPSKLIVQAVMANRMHRQGLEGHPRNHLAYLKSESGSPKNWYAIAHENRRNEGYARFKARLTLKWVGQAVMANRMHRQGLDGSPRTNFAFLTSKSGSPKKWFSIAHENRRNEGYARFELVGPSKWVRRAVRDNQMHRQGLEERPQKKLTFLTAESGSPKKWFVIAHENRRNEGYARFTAFDLLNGSDGP